MAMLPIGAHGATAMAVTSAVGGALLGGLMELTTPLLGAAFALAATLLFRHRALILRAHAAETMSADGCE